jgi:hypothetical protein
MLPVSLDCSFVASSVFSSIYLSCVLYTLYCQFLWIVLLLMLENTEGAIKKDNPEELAT